MDKKKREKLEQLYWKMTEWFAGDPKRIQHFVKVHSFYAFSFLFMCILSHISQAL